MERDPLQRRRQIERNLAELRNRIGAACSAAGREPSAVTTIVITKTWPASDVHILADLGVRDVGENRDQEGAPKARECVALPLRWHFVGQLQRNKAASVVTYCDFVHSIDRPELAAALDRAAQRHERRLSAFVQVDLDESARAGRGGARPDPLPRVCEAVAGAQALDLVGLMAVAPLGEDPASAFGRLAGIRERIIKDFPAARLLSAGMSGDLEAAIEAGATHVRVGSAVLGERHDVR